MVVNQGAYPITVFPPTIILNLVRVLFPNAYRIDNYAFDGTVVASNTGTYIAFRGPWESETWARERMIDLAARELGMEPADVRSPNLITDERAAAPRCATGPTIDHMTARDTLERACELADLDGVPARADATRAPTAATSGSGSPRSPKPRPARRTTAPRSARARHRARRNRRGPASSATGP